MRLILALPAVLLPVAAITIWMAARRITESTDDLRAELQAFEPVQADLEALGVAIQRLAPTRRRPRLPAPPVD